MTSRCRSANARLARVESALYWVDINGLTVHRLHPASGKYSSLEDGLRAVGHGRRQRQQPGRRHPRRLRLPEHDQRRHRRHRARALRHAIVRFNDGRVDPAGRFWVGTMYEPRDQPKAEMYVLEGEAAPGLGGRHDQLERPGLDARTARPCSTPTPPATASTLRLRCRGTASNGRNLVTFSTDKRRRTTAAVRTARRSTAKAITGRDVRRRPHAQAVADGRTAAAKSSCRCAARRRSRSAGRTCARCIVTSASQGRSNDELAQYPHSGKVLAFSVDVPGVEQCRIPRLISRGHVSFEAPGLKCPPNRRVSHHFSLAPVPTRMWHHHPQLVL
jgi:hypothetical protein